MVNKRRKDTIKYSDQIVVSDASPLIDLNRMNCIHYLKLLFNEVYVTKKIKGECHFELPSWIKIKDATIQIQNMVDNIFKRTEPEDRNEKTKKTKDGKLLDDGIDDGERSAIALVVHLGVLRHDNILSCNTSLILDDGNAADTISKKRDLIKIDRLRLRDIFSLAFDKGLFTRDEGIEMFKRFKKEGIKTMSNKDLNFIFNEEVGVLINKGVKR